jgi:hypothetical protein
MSNNYDLKTLKAVKHIFDTNLVVKASLMLTQMIAEEETRLEKLHHISDGTGHSKAVPTNPDVFDYWRENDMN